MTHQGPIQIDLQQVIAQKLGSKARYVPNLFVKWLSGVICQDQLNEVLRVTYPTRGAEFCKGVMEHLDISIKVLNPEKFPPKSQRRLLIVSNHPLGGLDGIALIHGLSNLYGSDIKFIVNDLLMAVEPLTDVFLPINKHGRQDRKSIDDINEAMASDAPIMIFPAGMVSRAQKGGTIRDLEWHKMFVIKARQYQRDVLPIFFSGENTQFFYKFAKWRERLGLKFNIEMVRLPAEVFKSKGKAFTVTVGDIIPWQSLKSGKEALTQAQEIKDIVYSLSASPPQS